jgi:peptidoglycan/LPS O-acetylase OafA/YrhL
MAAASVGLMVARAPTDVPTARLYYGMTRVPPSCSPGLCSQSHSAGRTADAEASSRLVTALGIVGLAASALLGVHQEDVRLYRGRPRSGVLASVVVLVAAVALGGPVRHVLSSSGCAGWSRVVRRHLITRLPVTAERTPRRRAFAPASRRFSWHSPTTG